VADPLHDDGLPIPMVGAAFFGPSGASISVAQEKTKWCWAASAQMIRRHVRLPEREQCEIAARRLGKDCCSTPDECNVPLEFDLISALLTENGVSSVRQRAQLDQDTFWAELFEHRPILLAEVFANGTDGHVRVAFGWQKLRRGGLVARIADPAEAKKSSTAFEELQNSRWRETWHRIEVIHGES
jgi:hypothetical protein